jgi:hypothetical protein
MGLRMFSYAGTCGRLFDANLGLLIAANFPHLADGNEIVPEILRDPSEWSKRASPTNPLRPLGLGRRTD